MVGVKPEVTEDVTELGQRVGGAFSMLEILFVLGGVKTKAMVGGGGGIQFVRGRSRMTIDPRIPAMPGRSTSDFR